jgi:hypothetical protein
LQGPVVPRCSFTRKRQVTGYCSNVPLAKNVANRLPAGADEYSKLANYLLLAAWSSGADCIVVDATSLRRFFLLSRLPDARVKSLLRASKKAFPHQQLLWEYPENNANVVLYLSRFPFPEPVFQETVSSSRRMALLNLVVRAVEIELPARSEVCSTLRRFAIG